MPVPVMSIKDSVSSFYYHNYYTHHRSLSLSFSSSSSLLLLLLLLLLLFLVLVVLLFKTGIITFDSNAALHNTFNNLTYQTEKALKTLVGNKFKKIASKWGTRIDKAEKIARDKLFTRARGDRPEVTNVMLIFTDGRPTGLKEPDFTPFGPLTVDLEVKY